MAHPLAAFIDETGDTLAAFAHRVGAPDDLMKAIVADEAAPDPMLARRIVDATCGAISFEQLMSGRETVVLDLSQRLTADSALDLGRLATAIRESHAEAFEVRIPAAEFDIAAEAVAHTYAALARVTSERGVGRLAQALRPVLREILKDHGALPGDPQALEAAVLTAVERYHRP